MTDETAGSSDIKKRHFVDKVVVLVASQFVWVKWERPWRE